MEASNAMAAGQEAQTPTQQAAPQAAAPQPQRPPQQPRQYKQREGGGAGQGEKPVEVNQSMPIPADRVGWIIGKQGVYIQVPCRLRRAAPAPCVPCVIDHALTRDFRTRQGLSQRSGCAISVSDSPSKEFGREWNYIHLQGTTRNVDRAKKLIYMRLEQFRATPPWSGQPNGQ